MANRKSQMWFTDFVIALVIFSLTLISYYTYTANISKQDSSVMNEIISDAKTVSSAFTSGGYPDNWDSSTVTRIGFTDNYNRIDNEKFGEFNKIKYNKTKKLLGTIYDYFLFFVNESNDVQNVEGFCGTGSGTVNVTYDLSAAYYYEGDTAGGEDFLKSFMEETFGATVYCQSDSKCSSSLFFSDFITDINNYDFIVVEHPTWSTSNFNSFKSAADPWLTAGGILFVGGQIPSSQGDEAFGVEFFKKTGQAETDRLSTVVNEDEFVAFDLEDNIIFRQAYYIEDVSVGADLKDIVRFNGTWVEFDDIKANGDIALARWPRGEGKILFFSDFDADYLVGNFQDILEGSAQKFANAVCLPINITGLNRANLVKVDRTVVYNSKQLKMVLYLWG